MDLDNVDPKLLEFYSNLAFKKAEEFFEPKDVGE